MRYFERQAGETSKAFRAFAMYRDQGPDRSQQAVAEMLSTSRQNVTRWASRHDWLNRAQAFDDYLEMTRRSALEEYEKERTRSLAQREEDLQYRLLDAREKLLERVMEQLAWPLEEERRTDGFSTVVKMPARWNYSTLARALSILAETSNRTTPTEVGSGSEHGQDVEELDQEFTRFVRGLAEGTLERQPLP